jgi:organic radical activating enzyme
VLVPARPLASRCHPDVRVLPQLHKLLGIL